MSSGKNCSRHETRAIETTPISAAAVGFPFAAQAGRLTRTVELLNGEVTQHTILLITSVEQSRMGAAQMLALRRQYWGIENGLHSPLDVSALEDQSRVRLRNNAMVLAVFRRLSVSLACAWKAKQTNPRRANLPGFYEAMRNGTAQAIITQPPANAKSTLGIVE